jgi:hypothetical protein
VVTRRTPDEEHPRQSWWWRLRDDTGSTSRPSMTKGRTIIGLLPKINSAMMILLLMYTVVLYIPINLRIRYVRSSYPVSMKKFCIRSSCCCVELVAML